MPFRSEAVLRAVFSHETAPFATGKESLNAENPGGSYALNRAL
jgi:hypothetical protein